MKHVITGDIHLGIKKGSPLYHTVTERLFANIFDYATEHKIDQFIHLGDFFHNRKSITITTIITALSIADNLNKVFKNISLITGNHDMVYRDRMDESLLRMFSKYENITVVQEPLGIGNVLLVPWLYPNEILLNRENKYDICLGHFDIAGATMNEAGTVSTHGSPMGDFNNFKLVLSGHYHTPGKYGNIQYLGSPFHTSFNDVAGVRGFYALDDDTCEVEFIEFNDYPKFIRIKDTDDPKEVAALVPNNIVELIFTQDHGTNGNIEIIERVKSWEPLTLNAKYVSIDTSMSKEKMIEADIEIKDHLGILTEYLGQSELPEHMSMGMLTKVAEKIYKETVDGK